MDRSACLLFITGDETVADLVTGQILAAYVSPAFEVVLEKIGIVDFEVRDQQALADFRMLDEYPLVLVSWMPENAWKNSFIEGVRRTTSSVWMEGPIPAALESEFGIETSGTGAVGERVLVEPDHDLMRDLKRIVPGDAHYYDTAYWEEESIPLKMKRYLRSGAGEDSEPAMWLRQEARSKDATTIARFLNEQGDDLGVAVSQLGNRVAFLFSIFSYLGQHHLLASVDPPARGMVDPPSTLLVESILRCLLARDSLEAREPFLWSLAPWPRGVPGLVALRHDVDRKITTTRADEVFQAERSAELRGTWFFRTSTIDSEVLDSVAEQAEIGWHAEHWLDQAESEVSRLRENLRDPEQLRGVTLHGGEDAHGVGGATSLAIFADQGMRYAEGPLFVNHIPFRQVFLVEGKLTGTNLIRLPVHFSLDRTMRSIWDIEWMLEQVRVPIDIEGLLIFMNHPDIHLTEWKMLMEKLRALVGMAYTSMTLGEASEWWGHSHRQGAIDLRLDIHGSEAFSLLRTSNERVDQAAIRIYLPASWADSWQMEVNGRTLTLHSRVDAFGGKVLEVVDDDPSRTEWRFSAVV